MEVRQCIAKYCENIKNISNLKFFKIPSQPGQKRNLWLDALGLDLEDENSYYVCEKHFKKEDIVKKRLSYTAVPHFVDDKFQYDSNSRQRVFFLKVNKTGRTYSRLQSTQDELITLKTNAQLIENFRSPTLLEPFDKIDLIRTMKNLKNKYKNIRKIKKTKNIWRTKYSKVLLENKNLKSQINKQKNLKFDFKEVDSTNNSEHAKKFPKITLSEKDPLEIEVKTETNDVPGSSNLSAKKFAGLEVVVPDSEITIKTEQKEPTEINKDSVDNNNFLVKKEEDSSDSHENDCKGCIKYEKEREFFIKEYESAKELCSCFIEKVNVIYKDIAAYAGSDLIEKISLTDRMKLMKEIEVLKIELDQIKNKF